MKIIGCDFHPGYQQIAMLHLVTGEMTEKALSQERKEAVRAFYAGLEGPVRVGIEASGRSQWFERMLAELGHEVWIGDAAKIRATSRQLPGEVSLDGADVVIDGMWLFAPVESHFGILVHQAATIDSRIAFFETLQTERTVECRLGESTNHGWNGESTMSESAGKEAMNDETKISNWDSSMKDLVSAVVEGYAHATRRAAKRGRLAAEDLIDEAAQGIKQRPLQTVALTFGVAFGTGALFGWIARFKNSRKVNGHMNV